MFVWCANHGEQPRDARAATGAASKILTLRDILTKRPRFSLSQRLRLCRDIFKAVLYIPVMDWVHKDLRLDNILFLGSAAGSTVIDENFAHILPPCYVAGFEHSTGAQMQSDRAGDDKWDKRYPNRQGLESMKSALQSQHAWEQLYLGLDGSIK